MSIYDALLLSLANVTHSRNQGKVESREFRDANCILNNF